jgi:monofunctional biosynthetic peptidoglycan transglycosylase
VAGPVGLVRKAHEIKRGCAQVTVDEKAGEKGQTNEDRSPSTSAPAAQDGADADALIAAAIQRIVREIPALSLQPSAGESQVAGDAPRPSGAGSEWASPLAYVPKSDDRVLPEPPAAARPRIEPTFDPPPEVPESMRFDAGHVATGNAAEQTLQDAALSVSGARTTGATAGWFSGPWTWRRALRLAGLAVGAYFATVLFLILLYRFINPPITTLIAYQWLTGTKIEQDWVSIEDISSNLLRAVVVSEDWGFCDHYGVDIEAIEKALEQAGEGKIARGASTISMQVIKNLFLSQSKSYLRKAVEIPLTVAAEAVWPKSRMLEIYLNIAEWGPGVFGAEAAARHHFNKPASRLSEREAALLAAALPNPILRDAGDPSTRTARKASVIQARMRAAGPEVADCAMAERQRPARTERDDKRPTDWQTTVKKRAGADGGL